MNNVNGDKGEITNKNYNQNFNSVLQQKKINAIF